MADLLAELLWRKAPVVRIGTDCKEPRCSGCSGFTSKPKKYCTSEVQVEERLMASHRTRLHHIGVGHAHQGNA